METVKKDDIVGMHLDGGNIRCSECMSDFDWDDLAEDDIIARDHIEGDEVYFCNYCKKQR